MTRANRNNTHQTVRKKGRTRPLGQARQSGNGRSRAGESRKKKGGGSENK